jgi:hypothetical protein
LRPLLQVLALALLAGCASPAEPSSAALTAGVEDDGDPAVVAIVLAADPTHLWCSGTLIADRVVLTAAHCSAGVDTATLRVVSEPQLAITSSGTAILEAVWDPAYDRSADHDLALLLLAEPSGITPIALSEGAPTAGPARLVGFGLTAAGASDADRRREGDTAITEVAPQHVTLSGGPSLPCNGDSGGPVLATTASGERLMAVVSRGDIECDVTSDATRVDALLDSFIAPQLEAWAEGSVAHGDRCLYDAQCATGSCAPALDEPLLRFCGDACAADGDCAAPLVCREEVCRHPSPSPGATGAACVATSECLRGDCLAERGICSTRCVGADQCPTGFDCAHLGGVDFYCLPVPTPAPGCHAMTGRPTSTSPLLALALVLLGRRRRERSKSKI